MKKTARQMDVKARFFQMELGIMAGFPRRSWRPTQKTKRGRRASAMLRIMMFGVSLSLDVLAVRML